MALIFDGKGQYLGRGSDAPLGISNTWSVGFWARPEGYKEHEALFSVGEREGKNEILISSTPVPFETTALGTRPAELRVEVKDADGTTIKHYGWGDFFQENVWTHTTVQWDGTDLTAFKNGLTATTGIAALVNTTGIMNDFPERKIFYGSAVAGVLATFSGTLGHFGMWNSTLGESEISTVVSGGFSSDLTVASGSYTSQGALAHYWKPGDDPTNLGKDFTTSATLDLTKQRNVDTTNITSDTPT